MVLWQGKPMTTTLIYDMPSQGGWLWFVALALFEKINRTLNDMPD